MNDFIKLMRQSVPSADECEFDATYGSTILVSPVTRRGIGQVDHNGARGSQLDSHFASKMTV